MTTRQANPAAETVAEAAALIERRLRSAAPVHLAIVTGSGLGRLAALGREVGAIGYDEIPGLGRAGVAGHDGRWRLLETDHAFLFCLSGRRHFYEGIVAQTTGLAMRVLARLGVRRVILTNAAGGLSARVRVGDLMLIRDHLNLMMCDPQIPVKPDRQGASHAPQAIAYDPAMNAVLRGRALELGLDLKEGIYAAVSGPSYETRAEAAMLARLGADAVGMSTVPEVLAAGAGSLRVAALSLITNSHYYRTTAPTHDEVLQMARQAGEKMERLLSASMGEILNYKF